ncbi:MAG: hypothetical protein WC795_03065, partial [Candidatus Paceibacterota bacterium]
MNFINKLRQKPESVRKQILYISVFSIMGVIIVVWLLVTVRRFGRDESKQGFNESVKPFEG